jgi:hypothetical protein
VEFIEAHDGQLWAENNPDYGAKFSVTLPCGGRPTRDDSVDGSRVNGWYPKGRSAIIFYAPDHWTFRTFVHQYHWRLALQCTRNM